MDVEIVDVPEMRAAVVGGELTKAGEVWGQFAAIAGPAGLMAPGKSLSIMPIDVITNHQPPIRYDAGVVIAESVPVPDGLVEERVPAGRYARATYFGPYDGLAGAWTEFTGEWLPSSGHTLGDGVCFEMYLNSPDNTPEAELRTDLYIPIA